jgi:hypothetical protein
MMLLLDSTPFARRVRTRKGPPIARRPLAGESAGRQLCEATGGPWRGQVRRRSDANPTRPVSRRAADAGSGTGM